MSYPLDLDEIPEHKLVDEIARRITLRLQGCCDYCSRSVDAPTCKFPDRHRAKPPGEPFEPPNSPCPRCSEPVTVEPCRSSYSRWVGGWEVVCKGCHVAFTGADTRDHALEKAQNLEGDHA